MAGYLAGFVFVTSTVLGGLVLLMIFHASRARWPIVLRRLLEPVAATAPLIALLFVPLAVFAHHLYPWANPALSHEPIAKTLKHLGAWYSPSFFVGRALFYVALWSAFALALRRWSRRQDASSDGRFVDKAWRLSGIGLVLMALSLTWASFDWIMSLTPAWRSSVFGIYVWAGGTVGALSLLVLLMLAGRRDEVLRDSVKPAHWLSTGKLLFAFVIFWAYMFFSQYFIIWIADLPEEVTWWVPRTTGWKWVTVALVIGHFAGPFFVLLSRNLKKRPVGLSAVAVWLLAFHFLDAWWLVLPAHAPTGPDVHWVDAAALLFTGGLCTAWGAWVARGVPLLPAAEPRLAASLGYEGS